jgi:hypothetical protein
MNKVLRRPVEVTANSGRSAKTKTAPEGAAIDHLYIWLLFFSSSNTG